MHTNKTDFQIRVHSCAFVAIIALMRVLFLLFFCATCAFTQTLLKPARVFDGETLHEGWVVRVNGDRIEAAGPAASIDAGSAKVVDLPGATLLPGLVEGHSHI